MSRTKSQQLRTCQG